MPPPKFKRSLVDRNNCKPILVPDKQCKADLDVQKSNDRSVPPSSHFGWLLSGSAIAAVDCGTRVSAVMLNVGHVLPQAKTNLLSLARITLQPIKLSTHAETATPMDLM